MFTQHRLVMALVLACFVLLAFMRLYTALLVAAVCVWLFIKYRSVRLLLLLGWAALLNRDTTPQMVQLGQHMWSLVRGRLQPLFAQLMLSNMGVPEDVPEDVPEEDETPADTMRRPAMRRPSKDARRRVGKDANKHT